jgi:UDP-N-acetylmuramoyl-L-alanyl-D-glutamate--2,6-diaminopimelate ligase
MMVKWANRIGLKKVIASLSVSHVSKKDVVLQEELDVFKQVMAEGNIEIDLFDELSDAIKVGLSRVHQGDVLMLAGCQGMDFGGHIALKQLFKLNPSLDKAKLFAPLVDRVCGIEEDRGF